MSRAEGNSPRRMPSACCAEGRDEQRVDRLGCSLDVHHGEVVAQGRRQVRPHPLRQLHPRRHDLQARPTWLLRLSLTRGRGDHLTDEHARQRDDRAHLCAALDQDDLVAVPERAELLAEGRGEVGHVEAGDTPRVCGAVDVDRGSSAPTSSRPDDGRLASGSRAVPARFPHPRRRDRARLRSRTPPRSDGRGGVGSTTVLRGRRARARRRR